MVGFKVYSKKMPEIAFFTFWKNFEMPHFELNFEKTEFWDPEIDIKIENRVFDLLGRLGWDFGF